MASLVNTFDATRHVNNKLTTVHGCLFMVTALIWRQSINLACGLISRFMPVIVLFGSPFTSAWSQSAQEPWQFKYKPLSGEFEVYGGTLDDDHPASKGDSSIAFKITGKAAKEMFEGMTRDDRHACGAEPGERVRSKGDIECHKSKRGAYSCYFGFNLQTGKGNGGIIC